MYKKVISLTGLLITVGLTLHANIWMPSIFSDNMVLQQHTRVVIWGWTSAPGETIHINGSWNKDTVSVVATEGVWRAYLETPGAGGPYTVMVSGHEKVMIHNVLIGEVWLCSGQSNMEYTPGWGLKNMEKEQQAADFPEIRFFTVPKHKSNTLQDDTPGTWVVCTPETFMNFSAVGYFFGREIHNTLQLPVGMINDSWGGTPIEVWIKKDLIAKKPSLAAAAEKLTPQPWWPVTPGVAYNAMIFPLVPYSLAGVLWYQGESNRENASSYYTTLPLLITSWRKAWQSEVPFYLVQIAPYDYKDANIAGAVVRDAQLHTMKTVPNTGMVVTNDIGNLENIHPANKQEVGRRLALWALAKTYGIKNMEWSGPVYRGMEVKGNRVMIDFDHAAGGLECHGPSLKEFTVAAADRDFVPAKAKIAGERVVVWSPEVKKPVAVRFAFSDTALPNLFNKAGLPASAFRTDNWEIMIK